MLNPETYLESKNPTAHFVNGMLRISPDIYLRNDGRGPAEEAHVEIDLPDWKFDDSEDTPTAIPSGFRDIDINSTGYVRMKRTNYQIDCHSTLHAKSDFKLFLGSVRFELDQKYRLKYTVTSKDDVPRTGEIIYSTSKTAIETTHHYPTRWRTLRKRIEEYLQRARRFYIFRHISNPEKADPHASIQSNCLDLKKVEDTTFYYEGEIRVKNTGIVPLRYVRVNLVLNQEEEFHRVARQIPRTMHTLQPGEVWVLRYDVAIDSNSTPVPLASLEMNKLDHMEPRGIETVEEELHAEKDQPTRLSLKLRNTNRGTDSSVRVYVRFVSSEGYIVGGATEITQIEAGEEKEFTLNLDSRIDSQYRIVDHRLAITT
ncbi:hypothetical protein ACFQE1_01770 [Halobium palmae]|uniref:Uncharacterized protein n=1 Tax=Halobium palmae TaxID=1776492 RepID=A0ABD5RVZ0_9EURY